MSNDKDIKKVDLEGESKQPAEKEEIKDEELDKVSGGPIYMRTTETNPPDPDLSTKLNPGTLTGKF